MNILGKGILIVSVLQSLIAPCFAQVPQHAPYPGGVALIPIKDKPPNKPSVFYQDHPVLVINTTQTLASPQWVAVVGIPLDFNERSITVKVNHSMGHYYESMPIESKSYPVERLTIPNQRKVTPLDSDIRRIEQDTLKIQTAYQTQSHYHVDNLALSLPIKGRVSSSFGRRRILNGIPKNPHNGMDIAAIEGTPILSPLPGKVILTGHFFYAGNFVLIDHGQGFMTGYAHLSDISVQKDSWIKAEEPIGLVGKTGRVTGSHLHWVVRLNGTAVDPQLFLPRTDLIH